MYLVMNDKKVHPHLYTVAMININLIFFCTMQHSSRDNKWLFPVIKEKESLFTELHLISRSSTLISTKITKIDIVFWLQFLSFLGLF